MHTFSLCLFLPHALLFVAAWSLNDSPMILQLGACGWGNGQKLCCSERINRTYVAAVSIKPMPTKHVAAPNAQEQNTALLCPLQLPRIRKSIFSHQNGPPPSPSLWHAPPTPPPLHLLLKEPLQISVHYLNFLTAFTVKTLAFSTSGGHIRVHVRVHDHFVCFKTWSSVPMSSSGD